MSPTISPNVKLHLLGALVPLGVALATAGLAAMQERYEARCQELADLKAAIAAEVAIAAELRAGNWPPPAPASDVVADVVEAELVGASSTS